MPSHIKHLAHIPHTLSFIKKPSIFLGIAFVLFACGGGDGKSDITIEKLSQGTKLFSERSADTGIEYQWGYKDMTQLSPVQKFCGGVAAGDVDMDGWIDLFIVRGDIGNHLLYRNMGGNSFKDISTEVGLTIDDHQGCGPIFADIDGDYDLDLFVGGIEGDPSYLLKNMLMETGALSFTDVTEEFGLNQINAAHTISVSFGDYDKDGWPDLFIAHWGNPKLADKQHLWRNVNGERFENVTAATGLADLLTREPIATAMLGPDRDYSFLATFADINNDSYSDLLLVSDFKTSQVLINQNGTRFIDATDFVIKDENGMGSAVGDIDNDGDLDWFVSAIYTIESPGNRLYLNNTVGNQSNQIFNDVTEISAVEDGGWAWAACLADFNLDGALDIFHVNGWDGGALSFSFQENRSRLFLNEGSADAAVPNFVEQGLAQGISDRNQGRGIVCFDADNDGDVDILAVNSDAQGFNFYRNDSAATKNYLSVALKNIPPNTEAMGARILLRSGGSIQMREIHVGSNFISQNPTQQYFGLASDSRVDDITVQWPDGRSTVVNSVEPNQAIIISHPDLR